MHMMQRRRTPRTTRRDICAFQSQQLEPMTAKEITD